MKIHKNIDSGAVLVETSVVLLLLLFTTYLFITYIKYLREDILVESLSNQLIRACYYKCGPYLTSDSNGGNPKQICLKSITDLEPAISGQLGLNIKMSLHTLKIDGGAFKVAASSGTATSRLNNKTILELFPLLGRTGNLCVLEVGNNGSYLFSGIKYQKYKRTVL